MTADISRRAALIGAAAVPLAACGQTGKAGDSATSAAPTPGQPIVPITDVPVGSGIIADGTLVTQPSAGTFKGFVARCTHAGCALSTVTDGKAVCRCHGSEFGLDGEVLRGPATEALRSRAVVVQNGQVVLSEPGTA